MKISLPIYKTLASGLLLFLFSVPSGSARAALRIDKGARHAALWQRIYDKLPAAWKTEKAIIVRDTPYVELNGREDNEQDPARNSSGDEEDSSIDGQYQPADEEMDRPAVICLLDTLDDEEAGLVFAHEYGHFIWDEQLTRSQRRGYVRLWIQQKRSGNLVTDYAGEDPAEGFAEAAGYFLRKPAVLRARDEKSWQFMRQLSQPSRSALP